MSATRRFGDRQRAFHAGTVQSEVMNASLKALFNGLPSKQSHTLGSL